MSYHVHIPITLSCPDKTRTLKALGATVHSTTKSRQDDIPISIHSFSSLSPRSTDAIHFRYNKFNYYTIYMQSVCTAATLESRIENKLKRVEFEFQKKKVGKF